MPRYAAVILAALAAACSGTPPAPAVPDALRDMARLPTGRRLDPAGRSVPVGAFPMSLVPAPGGRFVLVLSGWREQGLQVLGRDGTVLQTIIQPAAFVGAAFTPDGGTLLVSGGNQDVVYRYRWAGDSAVPRDSLVLAAKAPKAAGTRYPAGIGISRDGRFAYVAENLGDSLAVVDLATARVVQRLPTGRYPYGVAVAPDGAVYVSQWNGDAVLAFRPRADGTLQPEGRLPGGRHPSALLLSRDGRRLFVASASTDRVTVLDTERRARVAELLDPPPAGPAEGSTPNGLGLSEDGTRLYVAEGDANAIAVFDLSARVSGIATARGDDRLAGRIPTEWYPTAVAAYGDTLLAANGKGRGTAANPDGPGPRASLERQGSGRNSTLAQLSGTVTLAPVARASGEALAALTRRVATANLWDAPPMARKRYPPLKYVIYVIKENRTYDQVLGDLPQGDGDTSLVYFGRAISPNHHALAERFGLYDRFFVNAEVSPDGHNWSLAAYTTDYLQKTVPSNYSGRGRSYDYEGLNRGWGAANVPDDDVAEPANGYLWDLARRKGITFRNYGEFVLGEGMEGKPLPAGYRGLKPFLRDNTCDSFPAYDLSISDQRRADVWLAEFAGFVRAGRMPQLQVLRLPNDHTMGMRAGQLSPRAYMADNDLALGRVIEALSRSPFWRETAVFVVEDDAQNGPDHVDSHRSPLLVVSPWAQAGVWHRFANTTDVLRTIEEILGLDALSQFDHFGRPLREIWREVPDTTPYVALRPATPLDERNPATGTGARLSERLELYVEDIADEELFNRVLWIAAKGESRSYPGPSRLAGGVRW
ncbi:MAG: bifunctional YncE family protein/alkaline phosphatase family protein [Gemmatimonadales bacterium]|nr:bifunctional YncE family protein/alkaline phosphatase family protein [Gemmatimonadales bacterium]